MTNKEAQLALANLKRYISGGGAVDRNTNNAINMAISALKKQEEDRWIPIAERMPEENDFVLVTVSGEDVRGCEWKDSMALAVWTNQWNLVDANLVSYSISAWRPLPEPYAEEEA